MSRRLSPRVDTFTLAYTIATAHVLTIFAGGAAGTHQPGAAYGAGATTSTSKESPSTSGIRTQSHEEKFGDQYQQVSFVERS